MTSERRLTSRLSLSRGVLLQIWRPVAPMFGREGQIGQIGQHVDLGLVQQRSQLGTTRPQSVGDVTPLLPHHLGLRLAKTVRIVAVMTGNKLRLRLGHERQRTAHEGDAAALPARHVELEADGGFQALMGVAGDELRAAQAAGDQPAQGRQPEGAIVAGPRCGAQHLALAGARVGCGPWRSPPSAPPRAPASPLDEGGIRPDIRVACPRQRAGAEGLDLGVQVCAEHRAVALAHAGQPQRLHQFVHAPRRDALHVRLLDDGHQRPLHTARQTDGQPPLSTASH